MKKILIYLAKIAAMLALLAALFFLWIIITLSMSGGLFSPLSDFEEFVSYSLLVIGAGLFIFVCVKVSRLGTEPPGKEDSFLKKAKQPLILIISVILIVTAVFAVPEAAYGLREKAKIKRAVRAVNSADVIIDYQNDGDVYTTLEKYGVDRESAVINYDDMTVVFICEAPLADAYFFTLERGDVTREYSLQFSYDLDSPGRRFSTYYGKYKHRTTAVKIEMEDGSVWSVKLDDDYFSLDSYPWEDIASARESADEAVCYASNSYFKRTAGLDGNTVFIDHDEKTVCIAYGDEYAVHSHKLELERVNIIENVYLQAEIPLSSPAGIMYVYRYREPGAWDGARSDGIAVVYEDGSLYRCDSWDYYGFNESEYYHTPHYTSIGG